MGAWWHVCINYQYSCGKPIPKDAHGTPSRLVQLASSGEWPHCLWPEKRKFGSSVSAGFPWSLQGCRGDTFLRWRLFGCFSAGQLGHFVGLINFYYHFISVTLVHLQSLNSTCSIQLHCQLLSWTDDAAMPSTWSKTCFLHLPTRSSLPQAWVRISVDPFDLGVAVVLEQHHSGQWCPLSFFLWHLSLIEKLWNMFEWEALAAYSDILIEGCSGFFDKLQAPHSYLEPSNCSVVISSEATIVYTGQESHPCPIPCWFLTI